MTDEGVLDALPPPSPQGQPYAKERQLVELLSKAAGEIRAERRKVQQLADDNKALREQLAARPRGSSAGRGPSAAERASQREAADLRRQRDEGAAREQQLAQEVEALRAQLAAVKARAREQQRQLAEAHAAPAARSRSANSAESGGYFARHTRASSQPAVTPQPTRPLRTPTRHVDPAPRRPSPAKAAAAASPVRAASPRSVGGLSPGTSTGAGAPGSREYNELMMNRLRRALAPAPTKEQLGTVVHAMVQELKASLERHGARLPFERQGPCLYHCGRRKLHLGVDSGRLIVKCGGGHVDLLEFIERNKMCVRVE